MAEGDHLVFPEYPSDVYSEDGDIEYPSDTTFDEHILLATLCKHHRMKRMSPVVDFEARKTELARRVAFSSTVDQILLDCLALDMSTEHLQVTWEAIKLNPRNDLVWESRRRILDVLDIYHEELKFLNSNADDAILNNELFWDHILIIGEKVGTGAIEQQRRFATSILSAQPHMDTPWTFMIKSVHFVQDVNVPLEIDLTKRIFLKDENRAYSGAWDYMLLLAKRLEEDNHQLNLLKWMNQVLAGIDCQNKLAWSFRKSLVIIVSVSVREKELEFIRGIMDNDPTNNFAWIYLRWFVKMYMKELGIDTIDTQLCDVTDVLKYQDNKHAWSYRQWLVAEKQQNGGKFESIIRREFEFTGRLLAHNIKNYYAWSHRQWTLERFGGWEIELLFCQKLLENDICDAIAWNQKTFVIKGQQLSERFLELELEFARKAICNDPENEFPWAYLACLYQDKPYVHHCIQLVYESIHWSTMKGSWDVFSNRRWCINALGTVLHLVSLGYKPKEKVCGVVARLCSNIKLAADITNEPPCPCLAAKDKCTTCCSCVILVLKHLDRDAYCPWNIVHGRLIYNLKRSEPDSLHNY